MLGYPYAVGDKIAKLMPPLVMGRDTPLHACFDQHEKYVDGYKMATELRQLYGEDPDARRVIDVARGLEGLRRQDGIHAAAVVITREPLTEYLPVQRKPEPGTPLEESPVVTQYEMNGVQELGLLKMDFLGLRNLDVMEIALELIEASTGTRPDIDRLDLDDGPTFDLLRRAETIGVFQLEGGPMRALIRSLAPKRFEDVCRARRALPARADGHEHAQRVRGPQQQPQAGRVLPRGPRGDPRADVRPDDLPRAAHARRRSGSPATRSKRPTTCARPRRRRSAT